MEFEPVTPPTTRMEEEENKVKHENNTKEETEEKGEEEREIQKGEEKEDTIEEQSKEDEQEAEEDEEEENEYGIPYGEENEYGIDYSNEYGMEDRTGGGQFHEEAMMQEQEAQEEEEVNELYLKVEAKRKFYQYCYPKQKKIVVVQSILHLILLVITTGAYFLFAPPVSFILLVIQIGSAAFTILGLLVFAATNVEKLNMLIKYIVVFSICHLFFMPIFFLMQGTALIIIEFSNTYTDCFFFCLVHFVGPAQTFFVFVMIVLVFMAAISSFLLGFSQFYYVLYRESELLLPQGVRKYGISNVDEFRLLRWRNIGVNIQRILVWSIVFFCILHCVITLFVPIPYISVFYGGTTSWFFTNVALYIIQCALGFVSIGSLYLLFKRNNVTTASLATIVHVIATIFSLIYTISIIVYLAVHNIDNSGEVIIGIWYNFSHIVKTLTAIAITFVHLAHVVHLYKFPNQAKLLYFSYHENKINSAIIAKLPFTKAEGEFEGNLPDDMGPSSAQITEGLEVIDLDIDSQKEDSI